MLMIDRLSPLSRHPQAEPTLAPSLKPNPRSRLPSGLALASAHTSLRTLLSLKLSHAHARACTIELKNFSVWIKA